MPEETKPAETKPVETQQPDYEKLGVSISRGLAAELKPILESRATEQQPVRQVVQEAPVPTPEDIDNAIAAGKPVGAMIARREAANAQRMERQLSELRSQGGNVIGDLSMSEIREQKYFKKYEKGIKARMEEFKKRFPDVMVTPAHWKSAYQMEIAEHVDEITTTDREEYIRSQREAAEAAARPAGGDRSTAEPATEPETLLEEFGGKNSGWAARFGEKQRAVGQRGEDAEVAMFDRVFRSKMPNETAADGKLVKAPPRNTVKAFIAERRELAKIQDEDPSFGLGS